MNEGGVIVDSLVMVKNDDVFTNSLIIAEGTGYEHHSITRKIRDFEEDFKIFGEIGYCNIDLKSSDGNNCFMDTTSVNKTEVKGRKTKIYLLNEPQATYLITLLENNDVVREFKLNLVKQFYDMKNVFMETHTSYWQHMRAEAKEVRKSFTDILKTFIDYAREHGSKHSNRYYTIFTKMINGKLNISDRNLLAPKTLDELQRIEQIIGNCILYKISQGIEYKNIYQDCKELIKQI